MKTISDLNSLTPQLIDLVIADPEIGECNYYRCEDDSYENWVDNYVCYEEDGWCIEIWYKCCGVCDNTHGDYWSAPGGNLLRAWGKVTDIIASHYDEETDDETEFSEDELNELWNALDKAMKEIA